MGEKQQDGPSSRQQSGRSPGVRPDGDPVDGWVSAIVAGDRKTLAKVITLIESSRDDHRALAQKILLSILDRKSSPDTLRVGITGPPGAGKSTLIEALGQLAVAHGRRVCVLAVDPSSRRSGGSILGDKTRMEELSRSDRAFIRPSPSGLTLGGIARHTFETILCCEAAGYDLIMIETVGVGQSETAVYDVSDMFFLVLPPASGDGLQGIKKGILEVADMIAVNKADGDLRSAAGRAAADYGRAMHVMPPSRPGWSVPVDMVSALGGEGIDRLWKHMVRFGQLRRSDGALSRLRSEQSVAAMWAEIRERIGVRINAGDKTGGLEEKVFRMEMLPAQAAERIEERFFSAKDDR